MLVGHYELTIVSAWEEAAGRWSRGDLEIWRTPGGKVQGASDIDLDSLKVPGLLLDDPQVVWLGSADLASPDTLSPGLVYDGAAGFLLAPVWVMDGLMSWLEVDSLSDRGFWGRWDSGLAYRFVKGGRILPNPHGTFCATRMGYAQVSRQAPNPETSRRNELISAGFGVVFGGLLGQGLACRYAETDCGLQIEAVAVGSFIGGMIGAGLGSAWDD